jgi:alpha-L-rhamnosidase
LSTNNAKYIWIDPTGAGFNRWGLFRTTFTLAGQPAGGTIHLFADTRYRLVINGEVVCHGPARFFPARPEYDTVDISPFLRAGKNVIAVTVNSYGCVSFHSHVSVGGLIAWGEACDEGGGVAAFATDESWRAMASPGHRSDMPSMSFALNPAEYLDARALPDGWDEPSFDASSWPAAVPHADPGHWGPLHERSIPLLDEREVFPRRRLGAWAARANPAEEVHSFFVLCPGGGSLHTRAAVAVMTWLHSPRRQQVTLGAWWGKYFLNGRPLEVVVRHDDHLRQDFATTLEEGWNLLEVRESVGQGWWDFHLALPRSAGLTIGADKDPALPNVFLIGGPWVGQQFEAAGKLPAPLGDPAALPAELGPWLRWPRGKHADTPCRERAWRTFERLDHGGELLVDVPALAEKVGDDTLVLLYDFASEVLGRPLLDFSAAAGTIVDVTYTERLKDDGTSDVHNRFFQDMAERYVAREGRQRWQTFHPRGCRYMEVLVRGDLAAFQLHGVSLTRASYPVQRRGDFECSDPLLNEIWRLGRSTLHACMEDAYLDCPMRERGLYSGDFFVQFYSNLATFGDTKLFRRCLEVFLTGQGPDGMVPGNAHGLPPGAIASGGGDYAAIIVQAAWHYWARTGDTAFLTEWREPLGKLIDGLDHARRRHVLMDAATNGAYIDLCRMDGGGVNCALNCFLQRALHDGAMIFAVLDEGERAEGYAAKADELAEAIRESFWDERRGVFTDRRAGDVPAPEPSVPANALPLLYDIATPEQAQRATPWLAEAMRNNFRVRDPQHNTDCNVTSYFSFYALGALYRVGATAEAEEFMRSCWGHMLDHGAWTCWEYFIHGEGASLCHAWSSAPTHYLSSRVLGVTFPEPGNVNVVRIWPYPGSLQWAAGTYPHPAGDIHVSWAVRAGEVMVDCDAPEGVEVIVAAPDEQDEEKQ